MKKIALLLLFCFSAYIISMYGQPVDSRLVGIEAELEKVLDTWDAPGFGVAIVDRNQVVYAKGFGYRDYENKIPATENTLFAIGSCTKAFTTSVLGILRGDDKLSFDDSPRKYISELNFYNDELNSQVNIKDIMCHRTGLPRHDYAWYLFPTYSKDELIKRIEFQKPFDGVRESWYYNNFMYLVQGVVAERISGKSWEDNVRERIFQPIGMKTANLSIDEMEKAEEAAFGYETDAEGNIEKMDYYHIAAMAPAGSINASVAEMAEWLKVWINDGKYGDKEIIPTAFVKEAMSPQMVMGGGAPGKERPALHFSTYGYGWMCSSYKGHYRVQHGGNIDGFSASTCFFPSDSIGIVVLVNQNGSSVPAVVRNIIADRMLGVEKTDWNEDLHKETMEGRAKQKEAVAEADASRKLGTSPSHALTAYTGMYSNDGYGEFEITASNDSLFAIFPKMKFWLQHYHYDVFRPFEVEEGGVDTSDPSELRMLFATNATGDISSLSVKIEPALEQPIEFKRTPKAIALEKGALDKYVGEYELMGMLSKVYTKGETLFLSIPGQPEYELLATGKHHFSIKILDGYKLEFHEGAEATIEAVSFIQPNGTFKADRK